MTPQSRILKIKDIIGITVNKQEESFSESALGRPRLLVKIDFNFNLILILFQLKSQYYFSFQTKTHFI